MMPSHLQCGRYRMPLDSAQRPLVMGVLNVTPDSFSDGGLFKAVDAAEARARAMAAEGCDILDIGSESTRPDAVAISAEQELARLEPVLARLAQRLDVPISVDTYKAEVARRAVELGAVLVNDVWGLQKDPAMADAVAVAETGLVIMHNRAAKDPALDILADMRRVFDRSLALASRAGIPKSHIILDPGVGFGKTARQNLDAVARLGELKDYGLPILIGTSRKSFLGSLMPDRAETSPAGMVAVTLAAAAAGAAIFRVHDVAAHVTALKVFQTIRTAGAP
jgi:dihydropteroate synthase